MAVELSDRVFQWLLAHWAGYGENPAELFPSLEGADCDALQKELTCALQGAQGPQETLKTAGR